MVTLSIFLDKSFSDSGLSGCGVVANTSAVGGENVGLTLSAPDELHGKHNVSKLEHSFSIELDMNIRGLEHIKLSNESELSNVRFITDM